MKDVSVHGLPQREPAKAGVNTQGRVILIENSEQ
jgi:hypothetical protein